MATDRQVNERPARAKFLGCGPAVVRGCIFLLLSAGCGQTPTGPALPRTESSQVTFPARSQPSDPLSCAKGRIDGLWIKNDGSEFDGRIEAAWIGSRGDTIGMVNGAFWIDSTDDSYRFEATVSGPVLPAVLFELSGIWRFNDARMCPQCGTGQGLFSGRWADTRTGRRGRLSGEWGDMLLPFEERNMPLSGTWSVPCRAADEIRLSSELY